MLLCSSDLCMKGGTSNLPKTLVYDRLMTFTALLCFNDFTFGIMHTNYLTTNQLNGNL